MKVTVFTPTYNRAYILHQLFESLKKQTCKDFEWLVIDDGSTDNTSELFDKWIKQDLPFSINYHYYNNCGKQREINRALDLAKGELFFIVDSDDLLTSNAIELILKWEKTIPKNGKYCAFAGSDGDMNGVPTNPIFNMEYVDASFFNRDPNGNTFIGYDRPWVFYTDIHKKYKYPEFENEKFITEAVAWNRMANDGYLVRCFDEVIYLWEHQPEGYTASIMKTLVSNPYGYGLWKKELSEFTSNSIIQRFKTLYSFYADMNHLYSYKQIADFVGVSKIKMKLIEILYNVKNR